MRSVGGLAHQVGAEHTHRSWTACGLSRGGRATPPAQGQLQFPPLLPTLQLQLQPQPPTASDEGEGKGRRGYTAHE